MNRSPRRIVIVSVATLSLLAASRVRAQAPCTADADSAALADRLIDRAGEQFEGGDAREMSAVWAKVRRAVEVAPLNRDRLSKILQLSRFLNRPDSAIALANVARQRWPGCVMSDSALIRARALPPQRRAQ